MPVTARVPSVASPTPVQGGGQHELCHRGLLQHHRQVWSVLPGCRRADAEGVCAAVAARLCALPSAQDLRQQ